MEERDFIKRQISLIAKVLSELFAKLSSEEPKSNNLELTIQTLDEELNLNFHELLELSEEETIKFLKTKKKFENEDFLHLSNIFELIANEPSENISLKLRISEKTLIFLEYLQNNDDIFCIERNQKISNIKAFIKNQ
jgi:hypothetical protein